MTIVRNGKIQVHCMLPREQHRTLMIYCDHKKISLSGMIAKFLMAKAAQIEASGGPYNAELEEGE